MIRTGIKQLRERYLGLYENESVEVRHLAGYYMLIVTLLLAIAIIILLSIPFSSLPLYLPLFAIFFSTLLTIAVYKKRLNVAYGMIIFLALEELIFMLKVSTSDIIVIPELAALLVMITLVSRKRWQFTLEALYVTTIIITRLTYAFAGMSSTVYQTDEILVGYICLLTLLFCLLVIARAILKNESMQLKLLRTEAEKMIGIGQLAGGIAHDFNNQLAAISGCAELLHDELRELRPALTEYTIEILKSTTQSSQLTNQLLAFSQNGQYRKELIPISGFIDTVLNKIAIEFPDISVIPQFSDTPLATVGDPIQLGSVLHSILVNACEAVDLRGTVTITTSERKLTSPNRHRLPEGKYVVITISDTGIGMDRETLTHIFEPFFTTKERGKKKGMALAAAHGIVVHHNGTIVVESSIEKGSTFSILLPRSSAPHHITRKRTTVEIPQEKVDHKGTILIVDDETVVLKTTSRIVEKLGYKAITFDSGFDAIDFVEKRENAVDLAILDMMMPQLSGVETFHELRTLVPDLQVLLASGYSVEGDATKLLNEGAVDFLQKPYTIHDLQEKIERYIRRDSEQR